MGNLDFYRPACFGMVEEMCTDREKKHTPGAGISFRLILQCNAMLIVVLDIYLSTGFLQDNSIAQVVILNIFI